MEHFIQPKVSVKMRNGGAYEILILRLNLAETLKKWQNNISYM